MRQITVIGGSTDYWGEFVKTPGLFMSRDTTSLGRNNGRSVDMTEAKDCRLQRPSLGQLYNSNTSIAKKNITKLMQRLLQLCHGGLGSLLFI